MAHGQQRQPLLSASLKAAATMSNSLTGSTPSRATKTTLRGHLTSGFAVRPVRVWVRVSSGRYWDRTSDLFGVNVDAAAR
jgi:hypothetical protein